MEDDWTDDGGRRKKIIDRVNKLSRLHLTPPRVMDGFEVHIQFLDHLKRLSA